MSKTLDEYFEERQVLVVLKQNLQANLDALTNLSSEEKRILMRYNLIMIRQCLMQITGEYERRK